MSAILPHMKIQDAKIAENAPSAHHCTTLSGYIFATKAYIDNRRKTFKQQCLPTSPYNTVNFVPLEAEICWRVWGTYHISTGFASWRRYCTRHCSGRQSNIAALNRGRQLYSPGWPSRWALAHISSFILL